MRSAIIPVDPVVVEYAAASGKDADDPEFQLGREHIGLWEVESVARAVYCDANVRSSVHGYRSCFKLPMGLFHRFIAKNLAKHDVLHRKTLLLIARLWLALPPRAEIQR